MVKVDLKGVSKVTAKGRTYYYAWRGGPRLEGEPGSPEFVNSYQEAHAQSRAPDASRLRGLVALYRANHFEKLAPSTKKEWAIWLDRIAEYFGDLRLKQFDRPEIKRVIHAWRNSYAKTSTRNADYGMQVLSRLLSYAVDDLGRLQVNPCAGFKRLYIVDRSDIIWTEADLIRLKAACSPQIAWAVDLAAHTGLRLGDLVRLSWSHVGEDAIAIRTEKSGFKREAIIPLYDALGTVLTGIPKRSTAILTTSRHTPWTKDGLGSSFNTAKKRAGLGQADLHFNDLRGTAATRFYVAGLPERVIAEMMGWEEEHVSRIIRRYVGRTAAKQAIIRQLNEKRT